MQEVDFILHLLHQDFSRHQRDRARERGMEREQIRREIMRAVMILAGLEMLLLSRPQRAGTASGLSLRSISAELLGRARGLLEGGGEE